MKRTLVAVAVAAFAATSANAATVYNQDGTKLDVSGSVRVMLNKKTDQRTDLQNDGSRVKFKFSQNIGEGLSALGYIELRPSGDDFDDGIVTKKVYAGLKAADVGTLTFGKQATAADNFKLADPTEQGWSSVDGAKFKVRKVKLALIDPTKDTVKVDKNMPIYDLDNVETKSFGLPTSGKKVINFTSANWNGFGFQTSYVFADDANNDSLNTRTWQGLFTYENKFNEDLGVKAHALYSHAKVGEDASHKVWGLAAGVDYAGLGLAVDYTHSKLEDLKAKTWEIAATYQVSEPLDVYLTYTDSKADQLALIQLPEIDNGVLKATDEYKAVINEGVKTKAISLGAHYQVAKNVQTYVEYSTKKVDKADRENGYYAGLRVFF